MHTHIHTCISPAPPHEATAIIRRVCNPRRRVISRLMPAYLSLSCTCTHVTRPRHAYLILPLGCTGVTLYAAYVRTYDVRRSAASAGAAEVMESERLRPFLLASFSTPSSFFVPVVSSCRCRVVRCYCCCVDG